ncbi:MAG TPA: YfiR family protein [Lacunisphaera sp.]
MKRPDPHGICRIGTAQLRGPLRSWTGRWTVVLLLLLPTVLIARPDAGPASARTVKAAFLRNFAHYVTWPPTAFVNENSPWNIGILGDAPLGDAVEKICRDRTEQGRPFAVFRADTPDALPSCQIVFVAYKDATKRREALARLKTRPVLTVGDAPEFLEEGGIIRFRTSDRMEMSINLDQARAVSLGVQTQMLELAREVLVNGVMNKLR